MQILPVSVRHDGFVLTQMAREGRVALYAQHKGERFNSYEVIIIQTHKEHIWPNGHVTEEGEHYPSSRQWGTFGWTFKKLEDAQGKMAELLSV